jgi:hypothetical protein
MGKTDYTIAPTAGVEALGVVKWAGEFGKEEENIIRDLLSAPADSLEVVVDPGMSDNELVTKLNACLKAHGRMTNAQRLLAPLIGKLLVIMQGRPDVLKSFGANNVSEFCTHVVPKKFHVSRTDAFEAYQISRAFPKISPKEYVEIGPSKIKAIGRAFEWQPPEAARDYLNFARQPEHTRQDLLDKMDDDGINVDALNLTKIDFPASQATRKRWKRFSRDPQIIAYCEARGEDPREVIFNRMMDECEPTWQATEDAFEISQGGDDEL